MDKTVKLWDVSNLKKCLYSFDHGDVVTSVVFHPKVKIFEKNLKKAKSFEKKE